MKAAKEPQRLPTTPVMGSLRVRLRYRCQDRGTWPVFVDAEKKRARTQGHSA